MTRKTGRFLAGISGAVVLAGIVLGGVALIPGGAHALEAADVRPRVEHHLREAERIAQHFEGVARQECPRFPSPDEWQSYLDGEVDRVVLLVAHLDQAWVEAKRTGDQNVRRLAKAPRRRLEEARGLVDKLQACAADNGSTFAPLAVWSRIEREVPRRQQEVALPQ